MLSQTVFGPLSMISVCLGPVTDLGWGLLTEHSFTRSHPFSCYFGSIQFPWLSSFWSRVNCI